MEKTMQCEIITIGDELLIGQVVDTNSAWMAQRLNEFGIELKQITSVHDDASHIKAALDEAFARVDLVLTTGGLGPTKDDITKLVLCEYFGTRLVPDSKVECHIKELYKDRPDVLNRLTATQWLVPENCRVLENRVGSAPIMAWPRLIAMPGVPYEMKIAMEEQVLPYIKQQGCTNNGCSTQITHKTLMVSGISESALAIKLEQWELSLSPKLHLAYLPKDGTIRLRLSGYGIEEKYVNEQFQILKGLVYDYLVLTEDLPLELALGMILKNMGKTISVAESCTGGRLAAYLNKWPGSSNWFWGGVVAYDNSVKMNVLGVNPDDLREYGAVSEQVVCQMSEGIRKLCHTDYAIATSGIAGPDGGSTEKPVGTVWIAWSDSHGTVSKCFHLGKLREQIVDRACMQAFIHTMKFVQRLD